MEEFWPALPVSAWRDTYATLHMWTQIAGKVRLMLTPKLNHWWNATLYPNSRGLTTSSIPYGDGAFEIQFDFLNHQLEITTSHGSREEFALEPQPVAVFYRRMMEALHALGITVELDTRPQEVPDPVPFPEDYRHASYDGEYARRLWHVLLSVKPVFEEFRARFIGKCSPVHFFWGSFDLACTRFSGRPAPPRKGVISSEAYSHEVISAGFWPGGNTMDAAFYAYAVPQPADLPREGVRPAAAHWHKDLSEFILMYDDVRRSDSPKAALMSFLESTYDAAARLANWDRAALERQTAVRTV